MMKNAGWLTLLMLLTTVVTAQEAMTALDYQRLGQAAFAREDYLGAIEQYRSALVRNPQYLEAKEGLAEAFFYLGEYDEAYALVQDAAKLGKFNPDVNVLWGRVLLGQGNLEDGLAKFDEVLKQQPRHLGALFGRAEYQVMKGHNQQAVSQLEAIRKTAPGNLRDLLSLMLLYSDLGDQPSWEEARAQAMDQHSSDDKVHYFSALNYFKLGKSAKALESVDNFLRLTRSEKTPALLLKVKLLISQGQNAEALQVLENEVFKLAANKKQAEAHYLRGLAARNLGQLDKAQEGFDQAVRLDKDNEVYRIVWENLYLNRQGTLENPARRNLGQFHFQKAATLMEKNILTTALDEFRRGLLVSPFDPVARLARAQLLKIQGFETSYLEELEFIKASVPAFKDRDYLDQLEIAQNRFLDSLPAKWGYDLTELGQLDDRVTQSFHRPFSLGVYYIPGDTDLQAFGATEDLARYLVAELNNFRNLESPALSDNPRPISQTNEAFRLARELGQDYFLVINFREGARAFSTASQLYLGRTGRPVQAFSVYKKGLGMVAGGLRELADLVSQYFPFHGTILKRQGQTALINLGLRDGLPKDAKFTVFKEGALTLTGEAGFFKSLPTDLLGTLTVSRMDDKISEGNFVKEGFFDTMAVRDEVLLLKNPPKTTPAATVPPSALLQRQILNLR